MYTVNTSEVNMNKSLLTIGIVLYLGTVGCAGVGPSGTVSHIPG